MKKINTLLCAYPVLDEYKDEIQNLLPDTKIHYKDFSCDSKELAQDADIIFGNIKTPDYIKDNNNLRWVHLASAGTGTWSNALPENVLLSNSTGAYGEAVSEHMLTMTLAVMKCLPYYAEGKANHHWQDRRFVKGIIGSRVVVFGLGDIGCEYAKRMKALGAYVIGVRRNNTVKPEYIDELRLTEDSDELIKTADVIAMCLPKTPATMNFMSRERIGSMKKDAILINAGRGDSVDEEALIEALNQNKIFGAGLDTFITEPLPENSPFWDCPNLVITPHSAGFYTLRKTQENVCEIFIESLKEFLAEKELSTAVDRKTGYRKK